MNLATILTTFHITDNGFLPSGPVSYLTHDPEFQIWENLAANLSTENNNKTIRDTVDKLPMFPYSLLNTDEHFQRAYTILTMVMNSYIFNVKPPITVIPKQIAVPLVYVTSWLEITPILTHAAVDLYNWHVADITKPITLDNLRSTTLMTGTTDEQRFYLVMVTCEAIGGSIIKAILQMDKNNAAVMLETIRKGLVEINKVMGRMREGCEPKVFWRKLRPYLAGSENNKDVPNGFIYSGVSDEPVILAGGSAAQSSLFATIDAAFSIKHADEYFEKIKKYMPGKHRLFIEFVKKNAVIKDKIDMTDVTVLSLYDDCITQLRLFRNFHFKFAEDYIIKMQEEDRKEAGQTCYKKEEAIGSGGTPLERFLHTAIAETHR